MAIVDTLSKAASCSSFRSPRSAHVCASFRTHNLTDVGYCVKCSLVVSIKNSIYVSVNYWQCRALSHETVILKRSHTRECSYNGKSHEPQASTLETRAFPGVIFKSSMLSALSRATLSTRQCNAHVCSSSRSHRRLALVPHAQDPDSGSSEWSHVSSRPTVF